MRMVPATVDDFRGGLNTGAPLVGFPRNQFPDLVNGDAQVNGRLRRRLGSRRLHTSAIAPATNLAFATAWLGAGIQRVVIMNSSGSNFYYSDDDGETWTLASGTTVTGNRWHAITVRESGANWLYLASDTGAFRWDGASTLEAAPNVGGVGDRPLTMAMFNDRLYLAGHRGPNVQASAIGDPTDFTTPNGLLLPVLTDTGDQEIRGIYQVGPVLLVFFRDATAYISGFGQSDLIVATGATGISKSVGCLNLNTVQDVGSNSAIWLSSQGFVFYDGMRIHPISTPQLDDIIDGEALQVIEFSGDNTSSVPGFNECSSVFLEDRQQYWCLLRIRVTEVYALVKYDLRTKSWTVHDPQRQSLQNPFMLVGSTALEGFGARALKRVEAFAGDGFYRDFETGDTDDADSDGTNGVPIEMEGRLRPFIWRDLPHRKRARQIRVNAETFQTDAVVRVSAVVDGKESGGPNVLSNPGFEDGVLTPWSTVAGGGSWSLVQTNPRSGTWALQYDSTGQSSTATAFTTASGLSGTGTLDTTAQKGSAINVLTPWPMTLPQPDGTIDTADLRWFTHTFSGPFTSEVSIADAADPGDTWEFLAWAQTDAPMFVSAAVIYRDAGQNIVGSKSTRFDIIGATGGFRPLRVAAVAPDNTVEVQGRIALLFSGSSGPRAWFDDTRLRKLNRKPLSIPSTEDEIPRQPLKANVNGRGRTHQVGIYTTDRVEIVSVEERAEILREP